MRGKKCDDETAAIELLGSASKSNLLESPCIRIIEHGKNKDEYWSYKHMIVQLEDCIDAFTYIAKNRGINADIIF